jgi:hypothetical protein
VTTVLHIVPVTLADAEVDTTFAQIVRGEWA